MSKQVLQAFLYKTKLNEVSMLSILDKFKPATIESIYNDLTELQTSKRKIFAFSDGNCKSNGKKNARGGYSVYFPDYADFNKTRLVTKDPTNNVCELKGIKTILQTVSDNLETFKDSEVVICTDSSYSIKCLTLWHISWTKNNWKTSKGDLVKNKDLITDILHLQNNLDPSITISFKHVLAHTKEPKNKESMDYFLYLGNKIVDDNINKMLEKKSNE